MSSKSLQKKLDQVLAKAQAIQSGLCPECGASEWIKVGMPGMWDYECDYCGHMQPNSPYTRKAKEVQA